MWSLTLSHLPWPTPRDHRKYLRDADRQVLAQRAFILTVKVLEDTLSELAEVPYPQPSTPMDPLLLLWMWKVSPDSDG